MVRIPKVLISLLIIKVNLHFPFAHIGKIPSQFKTTPFFQKPHNVILLRRGVQVTS